MAKKKITLPLLSHNGKSKRHDSTDSESRQQQRWAEFTQRVFILIMPVIVDSKFPYSRGRDLPDSGAPGEGTSCWPAQLGDG